MSAVPQGPTAVSPFTGLSDDSVAEKKFDSLWQSGAFDSQKPSEAAQLAAERQAQRAESPQPEPQSPQPAPPEPAQPEPAPAPQEAEPDDYQSVEDYLTKAQIEQASFYELPVTVKVDGKTSQVKLSDVLRSYQIDSHVTQRSQALAAEREQWQAERQAAQTALTQQLEAASALSKLAEQRLMSEFQNIDWKNLEAQDPGRAALVYQRYLTMRDGIKQHLTDVQRQQAALEEQRQQAIAASLPQEREKMLDAIPAWRDEKQFAADRTEMQLAAKQLGFTDAEISQIYDHRYMQALHYASQFLKLQAQAPQAVKRVRAAPQVSNPGARNPRDPKVVVSQQARERWKGSKFRDETAGAAYFETLAS